MLCDINTIGQGERRVDTSEAARSTSAPILVKILGKVT